MKRRPRSGERRGVCACGQLVVWDNLKKGWYKRNSMALSAPFCPRPAPLFTRHHDVVE